MKRTAFIILGCILMASCKNEGSKELYDSGTVKYDKQDYKGAIADYSKAIDADANDTEAYNGRGNAKYE